MIIADHQHEHISGKASSEFDVLETDQIVRLHAEQSRPKRVGNSSFPCCGEAVDAGREEEVDALRHGRPGETLLQGSLIRGCTAMLCGAGVCYDQQRQLQGVFPVGDPGSTRGQRPESVNIAGGCRAICIVCLLGCAEGGNSRPVEIRECRRQRGNFDEATDRYRDRPTCHEVGPGVVAAANVDASSYTERLEVEDGVFGAVNTRVSVDMPSGVMM